MKKKHEEICTKVDSLFKESLEYKRQFHEQWIENEKFYHGVHWPKSVKRPYKNHVFQIIESEVPVLTDSRPSTSVKARDEESEDAAIILNAAKDHVYRSQHVNLKDAMSIKSFLINGTSYQYVDFDPDLADGEGDVVVKNIPWQQVYPDHAADEIDFCRYFGFKFPVDVEDVKRRFPKFKGKIPIIPPNDLMNNNEDSTDFGEDNNYGNNSGSSEKNDRYKSETMTTLDEMWMKDYSTEKVSEEETQEEIMKESIEIQQGINPDITKYENHEAHINGHVEQIYILAAEAMQISPEEVTDDILENLKQDEEVGLIISIALDHIEMHKSYVEAGYDEAVKPIYPDNLRVVIKVGKEVLYDGPNPFEDGLYPVAPFYCYKDEGSFYGTGEAKNIIPINKSLNEMDWSEYASLRLNGNSGWVVDSTSGVDESTLTNEPGLVIVKKQGTEARRLEAGQTSPQLAYRRDADKLAMQEISGMNEATMGKAPTNDPSGRAIVKLQQQAIGRIRLKSRGFEEYSLPKRDRLILSRIMRCYSTERKLRIEDQDGEIQFISFTPEEVQDFDYDLILSSGTSAGLDKESMYSIFGDLMNRGIIDPKTFVDIADLPQKGKVIKNINENNEKDMMLQQLQEQNLMLKAQFAPETLTEEEVEILEQQNQGQESQ